MAEAKSSADFDGFDELKPDVNFPVADNNFDPADTKSSGDISPAKPATLAASANELVSAWSERGASGCEPPLRLSRTIEAAAGELISTFNVSSIIRLLTRCLSTYLKK